MNRDAPRISMLGGDRSLGWSLDGSDDVEREQTRSGSRIGNRWRTEDQPEREETEER